MNHRFNSLKRLAAVWSVILSVVLALTGLAAGQSCVQPPPGMISWWPGDGAANDIAGANDGSLQGGAGFASGKVGMAFALDGVDDYVDAGNDPSLHVSAGDFTVDAWVLFSALSHPPGTNNGRPAGDMSIVDKIAGSSDNGDGWRLLKQDDGRFWFCFGQGTNGCFPGSPTTVTSTTFATTGVWYHVAGVKSAAAISIYVNGALQATAPAASGFIVDTNSTGVRIGGNAQYGAHLNGLIDEVEIYGRALTASEIAAIYAAGSAGKCKVTQVSIDIKPGSFPNSINLSSSGVVPVAILGSATFDATQVDPASVTLAGARVKLIGKGDKYSCSVSDVNGDAIPDLVCHVMTAQFLIEPGDSVAVLEAVTFGGQAIRGEDSINIVQD